MCFCAIKSNWLYLYNMGPKEPLNSDPVKQNIHKSGTCGKTMENEKIESLMGLLNKLQ